MEKEFLVLSQIAKNELSPQRQIADNTGLSLGTVNIILKRMTRKGLVKVERLNKRNLRYILTPVGVAEKSRMAYSYARRSYRLISLVITAVQKLMAEEDVAGRISEVVLFGDKDDFCEILMLAFSREKTGCRVVKGVDPVLFNENVLVIFWDEKYENILQEQQVKAVNILKYM